MGVIPLLGLLKGLFYILKLSYDCLHVVPVNMLGSLPFRLISHLVSVTGAFGLRCPF